MNNSITKYIYINRENNLSGYNRYIINNTDVINYVNKKFEIISFEKMSLEEKFLSTLNSTIVISPIGANLVNFLFSNNDNIKLFILLIPEVDKGYIDFNLLHLTELGKIDRKIIKMVHCCVKNNNLSKDPTNNPYIININEIDQIISEYIATDHK
jgi:capsular polysaccharide biosynthesis protein